MSAPPASSRRRLLPALLAVVTALAGFGALTGAPATGAATKGALVVVAVQDQGTGLAGLVAGRPFSVEVKAVDEGGAPLVLNRDTTVTLTEVSGPGVLGGNATGVIARNRDRTTITGATYSAFGNGIVLAVSASDGVTLEGGTVTVDAASTAVRADATPGTPLNVADPGCAAPTPEAPVCGYLELPRGARGAVLMSVGACQGVFSCLGGSPQAGLVTARAVLKDAADNPLYDGDQPATFIVACDRSQCGQGGVPNFEVWVDVTNVGTLALAPDCPAKGVLGDLDFCLDTVQSKRDGAGDLYSYILFDHDIRASYP